MKNKYFILLILLFFMCVFFVAPSCSTTFKGKVLDADTKKPIEGAVVVASWREERATIAGGSSRVMDVKESLTNKSGEWVIKGPSGKEEGIIVSLFSFLTGIYYTRPPVFIVFKPGYCSYRKGDLVEVCRSKMKSYGITNSKNIGEIVELPKLSNRKDRKLSLPGAVGFSREFDKKQLKFLRLINEERKNIFGKSDLEDYIKELENEQ